MPGWTPFSREKRWGGGRRARRRRDRRPGAARAGAGRRPGRARPRPSGAQLEVVQLGGVVRGALASSWRAWRARGADLGAHRELAAPDTNRGAGASNIDVTTSSIVFGARS